MVCQDAGSICYFYTFFWHKGIKPGVRKRKDQRIVFSEKVKIMKKIILALLIVQFSGSLCLAQQVSTAGQTASVLPEVRTVNGTGKISLIIIGDFAKGIKSQLSIGDDYGRTLSFSVSDDTLITDKAGKTITLGDLKKDNRVSVVYVIGKRVNRAQSIKLLER